MKIESLRVPPARRSETPAKQASTAARPFGPPIKAAPKAHAPIAAQERRHTQRVMLRIRASIHVALQGKQSILEATTLSVNDHGAVVVVGRNLPENTPLILEHGHTKEKVACKVARPAREMAEGFQIPIEFDSPAPDFWKIAFPPSDWRADEV